MMVPCVFEGMEEKTSTKGKTYALVYVHGVDEDGNETLKQYTYMTFDEMVVGALRTKQKGDNVNLDLVIREAVIEGVGV